MTDWAKASRLASRYRYLVSMVARHGQKYYKQHGNWIYLPLTPQVCLTMDSWNSSIDLCREPTSYVNSAVGFDQPRGWARVGIDFGRLEVKVSEARLESLIRATEAAVSREALVS